MIPKPLPEADAPWSGVHFFVGSLLKETPQLTVPYHYFVRVVIIASSSSHRYFLSLLLLVFLQPMKVSGREEPIAKLATHHLTLMMPLSELVRKPRVDRQFWGGSRLQGVHSTRKTPGRFVSLLLLLLPRNLLPRRWLNKKKLQKSTTFAHAVIYDKQLNALGLRPEPAYPFVPGHCSYGAIARASPFLRKSGGHSHISGTSGVRRLMARTFILSEGLIAIRL